jgi:hypothetical protein
MSWQEKLHYISHRASIEHVVNGQTLNFYPISVGYLFKLKSLASPLSKAIMTLLTNTSKDVVEQTHQELDENEKIRMAEVSRSAIDPELATMRLTEKQVAITEFVETILSDDTYTLLANMLMDSLKEVFPPKDPNNPPVKEFQNTLTSDVIGDFAIGLYKANKGIFDPFVKSLPKDVVDGVKAQVKGKLGQSEN